MKICVDTTIQRVVSDIYRGRIFALYDVLFNAVFVAATALAAVVLPTCHTVSIWCPLPYSEQNGYRTREIVL